MRQIAQPKSQKSPAVYLAGPHGIFESETGGKSGGSSLVCLPQNMEAMIKDENAIDQFIRLCPKGHFMQSPAWGKVKKGWTNEIVYSLDENGNIKGTLSLLIRKMPLFGASKMYAPRGPVCNPNDEATLADLVKKAAEVAKKHKSYSLMIDPDIPKENTAFIGYMKELGFAVDDSINAFDGVQPHFVFRLPIAGRSDEEIMAGFDHQTRKNVRRAVKFGVTSRVAERSEMPKFFALVQQTSSRQEFNSRNIDYFYHLYDTFAPNGDLLFLLMEYEGEVLAGVLALGYGNKVWSLYSGTANVHRDKKAAHLMRMDTIRWGKEKGCEIYDLMGVPGEVLPTDPLYGLYSFKRGFGGELIEFAGEFSIVYNPAMNFICEKAIAVYRKLRKRKPKERKA